jgi:hypothetical protein
MTGAQWTNLTRSILALMLTLSLPFVIYFGDASAAVAQTYQDALAAVVAFYFGATQNP